MNGAAPGLNALIGSDNFHKVLYHSFSRITLAFWNPLGPHGQRQVSFRGLERGVSAANRPPDVGKLSSKGVVSGRE